MPLKNSLYEIIFTTDDDSKISSIIEQNGIHILNKTDTNIQQQVPQFSFYTSIVKHTKITISVPSDQVDTVYNQLLSNSCVIEIDRPTCIKENNLSCCTLS